MTKPNRRWFLAVFAVAASPLAAQTAAEVVLHNFGRSAGAQPFATPFRDSAGNLYGTTDEGGPDYAGSIFKLDAAGNYTSLYNFTRAAGGYSPTGGVIRDAAGSLYGTTGYGSATSSSGAGVVYKLDAAGNYTVLHSFTGGADGGGPYAGVTRDSGGNLYGTTVGGGIAHACLDLDYPAGCGVIYRIDTSGNYTLLHRFSGTDGERPYAGVILDSTGNLYGTASQGGDAGACELAGGCGVVYKLDQSGNFTVLHSFTGVDDGAYPYGGLARDSAGNLYGTTYYGNALGAGTVYRTDTAGNLTVLYRFGGGAEGGSPYAAPILDSAGNIYGTTSAGGASGDGVVFKLDAGLHETVLQTFAGMNGSDPRAGLIQDSAGNLYGATVLGGETNGGVVYMLDPAGHETVLHSFSNGRYGSASSSGVSGDPSGNFYGTAYWGGTGGSGVVYQMNAAGNYSTLYSFTGGADGGNPIGGVFRDAAGNLYGTTYNGGPNGYGVVYEVAAAGQQTVLYAFTGGTDGGSPNAGVIADSDGNLYGTTYLDGVGNAGVVFKLTPSGQQTVLHSFAGADGSNPYAGVVRDAAGNLYGTTLYGGSGNQGVVYEIDAAGNYTVLHNFAGGSDGGYPEAGLILDAAGSLYGTAQDGGAASSGVVYQIDAAGNFTVLYSFAGGTAGGNPFAGVVRDAAGNLYGNTHAGGTGNTGEGCGVVYKLDTAGNYSVLYTFNGTNDGCIPEYPLLLGTNGNLLGATSSGGTRGTGMIFEIKPQ